MHFSLPTERQWTHRTVGTQGALVARAPPPALLSGSAFDNISYLNTLEFKYQKDKIVTPQVLQAPCAHPNERQLDAVSQGKEKY